MTTPDVLHACLSAPITASLERRTITGRLVPWGEVGNTSAGPTVFAADSIELPDDPARVKLLRDHDTTAPVGHATGFDPADDGLYGTFRVPEGDAGDLALLEASERLRDGLSVGVRLLEADHGPDGTLEVRASYLLEVSQVALPAFDSARTLAVAASAPVDPTLPEGEPMSTNPTTPDTELEDDLELEAQTAPVVAAASRELRPARRSSAPMDLRAVAGLIAATNRGESTIGELRAALNKVTTTEVAGIVPDYIGELVGLIDPGRPTLNMIRRRNLPPAGMKITYPAFERDGTTGAPKSGKVDKHTTELTDIATDAFAIELLEAPVEVWAGGQELSMESIDRSDPSAVAAVLEALAIHYGVKTNAAVVNELLASAAAATGITASSKVVDIFAALVAALDPMETPPGPLFASVAWDLLPKFIKSTDADRPAFWDGSISFGSMVPTVSADGLTVVVDRSLPAGTVLLGSTLGATWWENPGAPAEIRAVDVSILGVDLGLYGYGAITLEYPKGFAKVTVPAT